MINRERLRVGLMLFAFVGIGWGFTVPAPKLVTLPMAEHLALRMGIGALVALLAARRLVVAADFTGWGLLSVAMCALGSPLFVMSAAWGSPNVAIALAWASPIWRALFGRILLKEEFQRRFGIRAALFGGALILLIAVDFRRSSFVPLLAGFLSGLCLALWSVARAKRGSESRTDVVLGFAFAALIAASVSAHSPAVLIQSIDASNALGVLLTGSLAGAAYVVIAWADRVLPGATTLYICATEIFFGITWTWALLHRLPTLAELVASVVIFVVAVWEGQEAARE